MVRLFLENRSKKLNFFIFICQKFINEKYFLVKEKFDLVLRNLEMSYYLLIISNLVLELLIVIYILF